MEAVLHGADAVYIGGPAFGARHHAGNTVQDLARLVEFAHPYHVRIFATLNTILHEAELEPACKLIWELYDAGVDALIIQDMGLLELDLPPIELHASTQCDIRTPEKARFLADCGFSQLVLARELSIPEIQAIQATLQDTNTALEYFVHGALCVAFSGQCYISHAQTGRSANRGDCSQACRLPFTLTDQSGGVVAYEKHLLSMKDNNQSENLAALIDAGICSFKIEGRYKEAPYVKNITAHYRQLLDGLLSQRPELAPAASGRCTFTFTPNPDKTFHRGSTDYFATGRKDDIGAFDSPAFVGLPLGTLEKITPQALEISTHETLSNGDGLNYSHKRVVHGIQANTVERISPSADGTPRWRVVPNEPISSLIGLKPGLTLNRNRDHAWEQALLKKSGERRIPVSMILTDGTNGELCLTIQDPEGYQGCASLLHAQAPAQAPRQATEKLRQGLSKLGNTQFVCDLNTLEIQLPTVWFIPPSSLNTLRRDALAALVDARQQHWPRTQRKPETSPIPVYPENSLSYLANIYNSKARQFYERHGVQIMDLAYEAHQEADEVSLMITKHCLRFSFNLCPKQAKGIQGVMGQVRADPMTLLQGKEKLTLKFDCRACEMHVMGKMRKSILKSLPPSQIPQATESVIQFYKR